MKRFYLHLITIQVILFLGTVFSVHATTTFDMDTINADYTFCDDTIKVNSQVVVTENATLTICPGTVVEFQGHYKLKIYGRLVAIGTSKEHIVFTARDTTEGWHGIRFLYLDSNILDTSKLSYCILQYGNATGVAPDNRGGAMYISNSSKIIMESCLIEKNKSDFYAGGIGIFHYSTPLIRNCIIRKNSALYGGGMHITLASHPTVENCIIHSNTGKGGLFIEYSSNPILKNSTITENNYFGIRTSNNGHPNIINCVIWNNEMDEISNNANITIKYSDIEGGWSGEGNIDTDPVFRNPNNSDFSLDELSPCINAGYAGYTLDSIHNVDLNGLVRILYDTIDMGPYEFENPAPHDIHCFKNSIYENELPGSLIGFLSATDDFGGDSILFSLPEGMADNAAFYLNGDSVLSAKSFNFEEKSQYLLHVKASDNWKFPASTEEDIVINVLNRNEPPSEIHLSDSTIVENQPLGTFVGLLSTNDPDITDVYTYNFRTGEGDTNNVDFIISGDSLISNAIFNIEENPILSVRIEALRTKSKASGITKVVLISVLRMNYAPDDIVLTNDSITENEPEGTVVGTFISNDINTEDELSYSLVSGTGDTHNFNFYIDEDTLKSKINFDYEKDSVLYIRVRSTDNGTGMLYYEKQFTIKVQNLEEVSVNTNYIGQDISIFPNPMHQFTTIALHKNDGLIQAVYLYTIEGQLVSFFPDINDKNFTLNGKGKKPGLYLLKIASGKKVITHKLIIY